MANELRIGEDTYTDEQIVSGSIFLAESLTGEELQYDTLTVTVKALASSESKLYDANDDAYYTNDNDEFFVSRTLSLPTDYEYGTPAFFVHNYVKSGRFYLSEAERVSRDNFKLSFVSGVGLLVSPVHYGGIYNGVRLADVVAEIIGETIPFAVDETIADVLLYGYLPVASKRDNLAQVLFATGASIKKGDDGGVYVTVLTTEKKWEMDDDAVFIGGSVTAQKAASKVVVYEHYYNESSETVSLYDGEVSASDIVTPGGQLVNGGIIVFDEPAHDVVAAGTTIIEIGANYAVVEASASAQLTGRKYDHTKVQVVRTADRAVENEVSVEEATMVGVANGENVADRVMAYYSSAKTVTIDLKSGDEKPGDAIVVRNAWGELSDGIIKSMDITMSANLRSTVEVITDYTPQGIGNYYSNVEVFGQNGSWTVPAGSKGKIRVVLIGGGQGGASGERGADGEKGTSPKEGKVERGLTGAGGKAGVGGVGGNIFITTVLCEPGETFSFNIGRGGAGGVFNEEATIPGAFGGHTTFGEYTSADGTMVMSGYHESFGNVYFGTTGETGVDGGTGGDVVNGHTSGADGKPASDTYQPEKGTVWDYEGSGGGGGGASYNENGYDGTDAIAQLDLTQSGGSQISAGNGGSGGVGGAGADATTYGAGGAGGHGGGGGGGAGKGVLMIFDGWPQYTYQDGKVGAGGTGGNGGRGADGCVIIYW